MNEQKSDFFLKMASTPAKDALRIVEITTKDLECYINLS